MSVRSRCFVKVFLYLCFLAKIASKVEFTNIKCISLDPNYADFEYCFLKSVNRSYKYVSVKAKLYKTPVAKVKVNFAILKRFNGYKPFLYNITIDGCRFLKNPNPNPIVAYLDSLYRSYTNLNHTCPYDHDVYLDKLPTDFVNHKMTNILPFPHGDYLFHTNWYTYDINRATVNAYLTLS